MVDALEQPDADGVVPGVSESDCGLPQVAGPPERRGDAHVPEGVEDVESRLDLGEALVLAAEWSQAELQVGHTRLGVLPRELCATPAPETPV